MNKKIKYGVVGFGWAGKTHTRVLEQKLSDKVELYAICDDNPKALQLAKTSYQNASCVQNYSDFLNLGLDAISICTPHYLHYEMMVSALSKNIPFLVEKPVVISYDEVFKLRNYLEKSSTLCGTVLQHRFELVNQLVKQAIDKNQLGKLLSTSISVKWKKTEEYYNDWHGSKDMCGGGVLMTQAIHMLDIASWFNGGIKSVYGRNLHNRKLSVEDNSLGLIEYNSGALGVIDCSTSTNPGFGSKVEIIGTENSVQLYEGRIVKWGGKSNREIESINNQITEIDSQTWGKKYFGYGHIFQIEDFVSSLIENRQHLISVKDGLRTLEAVLAFEKSAKDRREVFL